MEPKFFVVEQRTCPECKGEGWTRHPHWVRIQNAWERSYGIKKHPREPWNKFIGYAERWYALEYPGEELPDEEVKCRSCGGEGFIQMETLLVDALKALGVGGAYGG